ncbi:MAG: xanthine dehydrogenase family protein molybdopterin-binding subunit [Acidobacteriota bacterium]
MSEVKVIGKNMPQRGSLDKVTGAARYTDDLQVENLHYGAILRSPYPHANLASVDVSGAKTLPGVVAVLTGEECKEPFGVLPMSQDETALAVEKVRYIGEGVAAVAAQTPAIAEKALALIDVRYDRLPEYFDPQEGRETVTCPIHAHGKRGTNVHKEVHLEFGDVDAVSAGSAVQVEGTFKFAGLSHAFLEPHSVVADFSSGDHLTVWSATQVPFYLRRTLARVLGLGEDAVRVIKPYVGGGFGGKSDPLPHEIVAAALSRKAGAPVKITLSREEAFISHHGRHPTRVRMTLGADAGQKLSFLDLDVTIDGGAYGSFGVVTTYYNGVLTEGPYRINDFRYAGRRVYTNHPPSGAMRGHGAVNARYATECLVDELAAAQGVDPCDFRLHNLLGEHTLTVGEFRITSNGMKECIERVRDASDWKQRFRRLPYGHGIGLGCGFFISGSALPIHRGDPQSIVRIVREEDGRIVVYSGASDIGQGSDTVLAQVTAEVFGLSPEEIHVVSADTELCPIDLGSYSSRVTFMAGNAAREAALNLKQALAAGETPVGIGSYESPPMGGTYKGAGAGLSPSYSFGASVAEVRVDSETGQIQVEKIWLAHDCGKALNPLAVEGQIEGSVHMGLGQFLGEALTFEGGRIANASLLDYKMVLSTDVPEIEAIIVESTDPEGPYGAKECGEGALHPVLPAVANAVYDAAGIRIRELPATPERVLEQIKRLTRISHTQSTTAADMPASTALRSVGLLDVLSSATAGPSVATPCTHAHLHRLATIECEKCGLKREG